MIPIKELLNRLKWDKHLRPKDYTLIYYDRISKKERRIPFTKVRVEGSFMEVEDKSIPLHRIRKVLKAGKVVWERHGEEERDILKRIYNRLGWVVGV